MIAEDIIKEIEKLPQRERDKVAGYFSEIERLHDEDAARRNQQIEDGTVKGLTHEEVFEQVRKERVS